MIRGSLDRGSFPAPRVNATLFLPDLHGLPSPSEPINFLIDTGATRTCLHPYDAIGSVGISSTRVRQQNGWRLVEVAQGVGGVATYFVVPCEYGFLHEDGQLQYIAGEIRIAQLTPGNETLPSLLGRDVLAHFRLTVVLASGEVTLE